MSHVTSGDLSDILSSASGHVVQTTATFHDAAAEPWVVRVDDGIVVVAYPILEILPHESFFGEHRPGSFSSPAGPPAGRSAEPIDLVPPVGLDDPEWIEATARDHAAWMEQDVYNLAIERWQIAGDGRPLLLDCVVERREVALETILALSPIQDHGPASLAPRP